MGSGVSCIGDNHQACQILFSLGGVLRFAFHVRTGASPSANIDFTHCDLLSHNHNSWAQTKTSTRGYLAITSICFFAVMMSEPVSPGGTRHSHSLMLCFLLVCGWDPRLWVGALGYRFVCIMCVWPGCDPQCEGDSTLQGPARPRLRQPGWPRVVKFP